MHRKDRHVATDGPLAIWIAYNDAANRGDHEAAGALLAPDLAVLVNGAAAIETAEQDRAVQAELIDCYPDYRRDFVAGAEVADQATVEWIMRGTATAGVDLPELLVAGCSIVRCRDGRIVEARLYHPTGVLDTVAARALVGR
jgi:ketosteroid isomerase-like protein